MTFKHPDIKSVTQLSKNILKDTTIKKQTLITKIYKESLDIQRTRKGLG